ncbi:MAG: FAD-dependent oxidoreductase [Candidatus Latescibacteria bacterium]|nr:FAD-dependent oxidoreductase [Candidatus Latescibacterota bacterium]MBT5830824.1 FAD-dependent oxidoreductase [Candidatus Latescibacterota bacterium]
MSDLLESHELECDILVAGGGPAGVPCALAAARNGAKVILCQNRHVLGGNASSEVRMHIVGADASGSRGNDKPLATETREGGIMEEIRLDAAVRNPQRAASMLDLTFYEMCRAEENLTLMLNTEVVGVEMDGGRITKAVALRQSTEDRFVISADVFVDCTGDGRLGAEAGAPFRRGRESKDEYGESRAQDVADNKSLGSTLLFQARKYEKPMPFMAPPWVRKFTEDDLKLRPHASPGVDRGLEYGYWWVEWGGTMDTIKDNEIIRDELLEIMLGVWNHIKNDGDHGAENWALTWFSFLPGKRESRRFVGQHVLSENDIWECRPFDDAIAFGGWSLDTHPPDGVDAIDEPPCNQPQVPFIYDIPLGCCVSRDVSNLMFAGRNLSATHIGFSSTRVMATCAAVGQGAGTAAAYAVKQGLSPNALSESSEAMEKIQQMLLRDDAYLIGVHNEDDLDVARKATVSASCEREAGCAERVLSGQTRAVDGELGAPHDRIKLGTNRWMSQALPASLELRWEVPVRPKRVHLIFDTGMHRPLTLSHSDAFVNKMQWGQAQEETVRDYVIEGEVNGAWQALDEMNDNYKRRVEHVLDDAPDVTALRVKVTASNGLDHARICEVRVYETDPRA